MKIQNAFRLGLIGTLGVGLGVLVLLSVVTLSTILTYVGAALFLALGLDPAVSWLERKRFPRWSAIATVFVALLAVVVGVIFAIVPIIVDQISQLVDSVPAIVERVQSDDWLTQVKQNFSWIDVDAVIKSITDSVTSFVQDPAQVGGVAGAALNVAISIGSGIFAVVIVIILTLYFTASLNVLKRSTYQLVPASKRARFADLTEQITQSIGRFVGGQAALGLCNGVLSFIFLSIIQAPFPAVLALIAFMLSLIPLVGTITGSVIIVLVCLIPGLGSPLTGLVAAIYYLIYMQVEAYLISPNIMKRAVSVPGAVVVVAALAGGTLLGVLGALVAIPVAASILLIIKQVVVPRQNEL